MGERRHAAAAEPAAPQPYPPPSIAPPPKHLAALDELISLGYLRGILNKLGEIERLDPEHGEFVRVLRDLATPVPVRRHEGNPQEIPRCPLLTAISDIVLIVDDIPENLSLLHDALDEAGYTVLVATNGESALQRARQSLPDVILLDALMPGMDGFEVARRLKADFATQHIPIVFMTGLTETEHVVAAFAAGGADYVTKPIRPPEVLARIAAHMQNARQMKQARSALDAFGQATVAVRASDGKLVWQTPLARGCSTTTSPPGGRRPGTNCSTGSPTPTPPAATAANRRCLLIADGTAACSPPSTTRPATTNGWSSCARKTTPPPSNP
jgi:CheY-like chemotaxis protein